MGSGGDVNGGAFGGGVFGGVGNNLLGGAAASNLNSLVSYGQQVPYTVSSNWLPSQYIQLPQMSANDAEIQRQLEERQKPITTLAQKVLKLKDVPAIKIAARAPDYVGTLTMWRGWTICEDKLYALGTSAAWEPRKAERAICKQGGTHSSPEKKCHCGYWGFKTMELLQEALTPYLNQVKVIGSVEIWGKVIECQNGFRAEYAYPKELWLLDGDLEHLSWVYGVPVRRLEA